MYVNMYVTVPLNELFICKDGQRKFPTNKYKARNLLLPLKALNLDFIFLHFSFFVINIGQRTNVLG